MKASLLRRISKLEHVRAHDRPSSLSQQIREMTDEEINSRLTEIGEILYPGNPAAWAEYHHNAMVNLRLGGLSDRPIEQLTDAELNDYAIKLGRTPDFSV